MTSIARALFDAQGGRNRVPSLILMSDPRLPDIVNAAKILPVLNNGASAIIYRHFANNEAANIAAQLRQICSLRKITFLIGKDSALAAQCGADGVHLPQADLNRAKILRRRHPDWLITAACHDSQSLSAAQNMPLDAITLSPVFQSESPSANAPLGLDKFKALTALSNLPVIALGGINARTAGQLLSSGAAGLAGVSEILPDENASKMRPN